MATDDLVSTSLVISLGIVEVYVDAAYDVEELLIITILNKTTVGRSSIMQQYLLDFLFFVIPVFLGRVIRRLYAYMQWQLDENVTHTIDNRSNNRTAWMWSTIEIHTINQNHKRRIIPFQQHYMWLNPLWPSDTIWLHISGSTLTQVLACCLTTWTHCMNQCRYLIKRVILN